MTALWLAGVLIHVNLYSATLVPLQQAASLSEVHTVECRESALEYVRRDGLQLAYTVDGPDDGRPMILVGGTDQQITDWPQSLVDGLVRRGFRVVRYDARDVGCSSHLSDAGPIDWAAVFGGLASGEDFEVPYRAADLSADLLAVLDALHIESAHFLGVSGGSTVAAIAAAESPDRVASLTLAMANIGEAGHPVPANPGRLATVPPPPPVTASLDEIVKYRVAAALSLEGSSVVRTRESIETWASMASARSYNPEGVARTGAALLSQGSIRPALKRIRSPAVVIHGSDDPLIPASSGRAVAEAIPSAKFVLVEGLGHALPEAAVERMLREVEELTSGPRRVTGGEP